MSYPLEVYIAPKTLILLMPKIRPLLHLSLWSVFVALPPDCTVFISYSSSYFQCIIYVWQILSAF